MTRHTKQRCGGAGGHRPADELRAPLELCELRSALPVRAGPCAASELALEVPRAIDDAASRAASTETMVPIAVSRNTGALRAESCA